MFVWRADVILSEITTYVPLLSEAMSKITIDCDIWELSDLEEMIAGVYGDVESQSIDYAVMEKSDKVQVVPAEMGWSDVGSWSALPEVVEQDEQGTVCINAGLHVPIDSSDNLIYMDGRTIATIGVHGLIIVSTPDALLVCDRERAQDVKKVVEQLSADGKSCL
jgi:Mannose-1-phosphate guanylyltransferase